MNHPISVGPLASDVIVLVAIAVGVARDIQPENCHFLSVSGATEQLVKQFIVGVSPFESCIFFQDL